MAEIQIDMEYIAYAEYWGRVQSDFLFSQFCICMTIVQLHTHIFLESHNVQFLQINVSCDEEQ